MEGFLRRRRKSVLERDHVKLVEWLKKQPHMPHDIEDELLMAYVTGTKSLEIAKKKLDKYYTHRGKIPHLFDFSMRDPQKAEFKEAATAMKMMILPRATPEGYRVCMATAGADFSKFLQSYCEVRFCMMCELAMVMYPDMTGVIFVFDLRGVDSNVLAKLNPKLSLTFNWFQSSVPMSLVKGIYFNSPPFFDGVMIFLKPFIRDDVVKRLIITPKDKEVLQDHVPLDILPCDYGGLEKSSDELNDFWLEELEKRREWFYKTSFQYTDERKRPLDSLNTYGVEGTFRSLSME